jgi:hypothetical protein
MRKLVNGYVLVSLLLVLNVSLYVGWRISLAGYWSDRVLFWIWLLFTAWTFCVLTCLRIRETAPFSSQRFYTHAYR